MNSPAASASAWRSPAPSCSNQNSSSSTSRPRRIIDLLRDLQARHKLAYLFISHDLKVVRAISDQVIVMRDGKVVEQGAAAQIFDQPKEAYTKALMAAAFDLEAVGVGGVVAT
jgi:microcin C transport system ATP-binding protein